jgi:hypothetical protein
MFMRNTLLLAFLLLTVSYSFGQNTRPFTKTELLQAIGKMAPTEEGRAYLTEEVQKRGVNFKVTSAVMKELTTAGAWPLLHANAIMYYKAKANSPQTAGSKY